MINIYDNYEEYMKLKYSDKWGEDKEYQELGRISFLDNTRTNQPWTEERNLKDIGKFSILDDWTEESLIRIENRYNSWSRGYSCAQREFYKTDEFEQKLVDLCEEYNMDIESGDGYQLKQND